MKKTLFAIALVCAALGAVFAQQETPMFFNNELMNGWLSDPVFSPEGKRLAAVLHTPEGRDRINRMIVLWDAASGREIRRLAGHNGIGIPSLS